MLSESLFVPLNISQQLHLKHFADPTQPPGPVVLMLHGAVENGRIFYSDSGKGFGCYLAQQGFDVYIADLAGRGLSSPPIGPQAEHGQSESICQEIPALLEALQARRPEAALFWVAHSWGGVLLMASLARHPAWLGKLKGVVMFGSKRRVQGLNGEKLLKVYFFWNRLAFACTRHYGYLPAQKLGIGSDSETRRSHSQGAAWVQQGRWRDDEDGFDYAATLQALDLPPLLYLAGQADKSLGHPQDVRHFQQEVGGKGEFWLLGKQQGHQHDYGHIDMLTHPAAPVDHFPQVVNWMQAQLKT